MDIFQVDHKQGRDITLYGSRNASIIFLTAHDAPTSVVQIRLGADGLLGYHQATNTQLFMIIAGSGWVRSEHSERIPIAVGQAALWQKGEWHETGTAVGLTAVVIEGPHVSAVQLAPILQNQ